MEELFWAVRKLLAHLGERTVVLVVEDVHWAEPTMLALVEFLLQTDDAPVVIVCPTRPELLERAAVGHRGRRDAPDPPAARRGREQT